MFEYTGSYAYRVQICSNQEEKTGTKMSRLLSLKDVRGGGVSIRYNLENKFWSDTNLMENLTKDTRAWCGLAVMLYRCVRVSNHVMFPKFSHLVFPCESPATVVAAVGCLARVPQLMGPATQGQDMWTCAMDRIYRICVPVQYTGTDWSLQTCRN